MCTREQQERYANFYTDFAFKKLFGTEVNKSLLISFLNSLFDGEEVITDLTYLNAEQLGVGYTDRKAVFDVYCENEKGERFVVEMQKARQEFFKDRSVFYSTFPIRDYAEKGEWDYRLGKVYCIGILNFTFNDGEDTDPTRYRHTVMLTEQETKKVFYDKLTFVYLEMPKFVKTEAELVTLNDKWLYAMRHLATLFDRPQALQEAVFERFFEQAEIAHFTPVELSEYEASLKDFRDMFSVMNTAKNEGFALGKEEGIALGKEQGIALGKEEGIALGLLNSARLLLSSGMTKEQVVAVLKLTDDVAAQL